MYIFLQSPDVQTTRFQRVAHPDGQSHQFQTIVHDTAAVIDARDVGTNFIILTFGAV